MHLKGKNIIYACCVKAAFGLMQYLAVIIGGVKFLVIGLDGKCPLLKFDLCRLYIIVVFV